MRETTRKKWRLAIGLGECLGIAMVSAISKLLLLSVPGAGGWMLSVLAVASLTTSFFVLRPSNSRLPLLFGLIIGAVGLAFLMQVLDLAVSSPHEPEGTLSLLREAGLRAIAGFGGALSLRILGAFALGGGAGAVIGHWWLSQKNE
jgi:hypothetical protein